MQVALFMSWRTDMDLLPACILRAHHVEIWMGYAVCAYTRRVNGRVISGEGFTPMWELATVKDVYRWLGY
jgi:hypothetical protein